MISSSLIQKVKKFKFNNENNIIQYELEEESIKNIIKTIKSIGIVNIKSKFDSLIIKNESDLNKLENLVFNNEKKFKGKTLYRFTKDGIDITTIIDKINNKSNLLFLYLTGNKRIFGAFIKTKLENIEIGKFIKDENAFVFSLNNNKIYKIIKPENAIIFFKTNKIGIGNTRDKNGFYYDKEFINDSGLLFEPKIYDFKYKEELTEKDNKLKELEIFEIY